MILNQAVHLTCLLQCIAHSIAYVGPSVTTLTRMNMGYKIYTLDGNYSGSSYVSIKVCLLSFSQSVVLHTLGPASLYTYTHLNMGFRIYSIDADEMAPSNV